MCWVDSRLKTLYKEMRPTFVVLPIQREAVAHGREPLKPVTGVVLVVLIAMRHRGPYAHAAADRAICGAKWQ